MGWMVSFPFEPLALNTAFTVDGEAGALAGAKGLACSNQGVAGLRRNLQGYAGGSDSGELKARCFSMLFFVALTWSPLAVVAT